MSYDTTRKVGQESSKTYVDKIESGFFCKYMSGFGLDIGYAGYIPDVLPILEGAVGIDLTTKGYDGRTLPFADNSVDYTYSSHFLEHVDDYRNAIREMHRVTKVGSYVVIIVPHRDLYEKKLTLPSNFNADHRRLYTSSSLLKEIEDSLPINSYRIRHLHESDQGHNYDDPPEIHGRGLYEIETVLEKLK